MNELLMVHVVGEWCQSSCTTIAEDGRLHWAREGKNHRTKKIMAIVSDFDSSNILYIFFLMYYYIYLRGARQTRHVASKILQIN